MDHQLFKYLQEYLTERRRDLFTKVLAQRTRHFTVATESVYQLHNTSAVIRSCDVFGIQDLHIVEGLQGKRVDKEIAMGSQKWVTLHRYEQIEDCMKALKQEGYQLIATTPHDESQFLSDFDVTKKSAFIFGKEDVGVSDYVLENADASLKIPMYGFTESLNISVAAAIILQEVVSKLRKTAVQWQLSEEERRQIEFEWTKRSIKHVDEIIERYYQSQNS